MVRVYDKKERTKARARDRRLRAARVRAHKCIVCGVNEPIEGLEGCDYCYDKQAHYNEWLQTTRRSLGLCVQCGEPTELNKRGKKYARCVACRKYQALWLKEKRAQKQTQAA